jgi:twitching motility protein PilT
MAIIDDLLQMMVARQASDIHLTTGLKPYLRIHGEIQPIEEAEILTSEAITAMVYEIMREDNRDQFRDEWDTDFAYGLSGVGRFRVNCFQDMRGAGAVLRQVSEVIPSTDQLNLPRAVREFCHMSKGLILVTGPTGSGKSTTLAALIDYINKHRTEHIVTIEDPIEFVHKPVRCLINQREVHRDTTSFARALRAALREDPDIVLVGEMRDLETIEIAIETAETGHLVFATVHTNTAATTVDRVIDKFPSSRQNQIRTMLGDALKGVVAQTLCRRIGGGRIAAFEVLVVTIPVANHIREGKAYMIPSVMQTSKKAGMQTFSDEFTRLVIEGKITAEEAYIKSIDKEDLRIAFTNAGISMSFLEEFEKREIAEHVLIIEERIRELREGLVQHPDDIGMLNDLAWIMATHPADSIRNGKEALRLAERVNALTEGKMPAVLDTLAAVHAENGNYRRAAAIVRKAITLASGEPASNEMALIAGLNIRLRLYEKGQPCRDK